MKTQLSATTATAAELKHLTVPLLLDEKVFDEDKSHS